MINREEIRKKAIKQLKAIEKLTDGTMLLAADWNEDWKCLLSTMLSAQTRDETTIKIASKLYENYLSLKKLAEANLQEIKKIIKPINYYKTKAKNIKKTAEILTEKYKNKIPHDINKLLELPGVGRKTANVFLAVQNKPAIGIDTHVAFLSQLLGWTKNKDKEKIEQDLKKLFPKNYWISINYILVRFGRVFRSRKLQEEKLRKEGILV